MGASTFHTFFPSKDATVQEAYKKLVDEALYLEGHEYDNGTISTTYGYHVINPSVLHTKQQADVIMDDRIDNLDKGEACEALRIMDVSKAKRRTVIKTVTAKIAADANQYIELDEAVRASITLRAGETLEKWSAVRENNAEQITKKYKTTLTATSGKTETRYFITTPRHNDERIWALGFKTQATARKALTEQLDKLNNANGFFDGSGDYGIISETRRENGEPLVKATRALVSVTAKVEVTIVTLPTKPEQAGWQFYGWAAS